VTLHNNIFCHRRSDHLHYTNSRLRNLLAHCFTVGLYYVTIKRQQIFKRSLQVTVADVFRHVTVGLPLRFFFTQVCLFSRLGCLGLLVKSRVKSGFSEVINSSATSMCSIIINVILQCLHEHVR